MDQSALRTLAERVVELNRSHDMDALRAHLDADYAPDAESIEGMEMPGGGRSVVGPEAIKGKWAWWESAMEVHDMSVEGPFLHGEDQFAVIYALDATEKESGKREKMREVGVYTVANGKIVREQFYY